MDISIADAHNHLSSLLKRVEEGPVIITRRGKAVGVLINPKEYERIRRVSAYLQLLDISREIGEGAGVEEIYHASRQELEDRT